MKVKNIYTLAVATLLSVSSCVDLDRFPLEELSDNSFWKLPSDAEMAVSNLYSSLPYWDVDDAINSDDAVHGIKWAAGNVSKGVYDPSDFSWKGNYATIRKANIVLNKVDEIPNYADADKNKVLGQAYFFRAMQYFDLIRSFGDVPYIEQALSLEDQEGITRAPKEEVYAKLMADLDKAADLLPVNWDNGAYGRVTKGAALALKARAALYYNNWAVAAENAKKVIDLGVYELYDKENTGKYQELFWEKADNCKEFILVKQFKAPENTWYLIGWETFPTKGWGGINPTQSLVDAFEDKEGAPIAKSTIYDPKKPFENRDPRLEVNVLHDGEEMYGRQSKSPR